MALETMVRISKTTRDQLNHIKTQRRLRTLDDAIQRLLEEHEAKEADAK
jgi:hypothetical protein